MTVRIVLGAPASGKTAWMIERILEVKAQNCFAPVWALVPDSSKVGYLRHRIALAGGSVGVKVATFGSFYADLLERSGQFVPIMPTIMDNRIVSETISLAHQKGILKEFANIREKPGLMQVLQDAFAELRGCVTDLFQVSGSNNHRSVCLCHSFDNTLPVKTGTSGNKKQ